MPEPQVTVRSTEAGRVTEVVFTEPVLLDIVELIRAQIPSAGVHYKYGVLAIRQPNGPDVVALAGETLRIAAGRVERVQ